MLELTGRVQNVLVTPKGTTKEGDEFGGYHQVQLLCEEKLRNGEVRMKLENLRADRHEDFQTLRGHLVRVPVGIYVRNSAAGFYLEREATPEDLGC